ncbi:class I SAM-dependent RNA methyltransferase [Compostimonas suwonensis]|uniref:tRNA/tmRNA/rRNA uracil-C5-methylase (TrmA/RlmC/RlmD family) n=1 Tax=Compostimonas suwonensis TaxID=1048394 RepID=A0A2M9BV15_9MICO|nr:TRAM domain-containing protein [Compostimonas suwonensis]PJJ61770.1 tRNA/tmRNA/rRNA uracil-C5-methylase (TrmA/RlmC/RlmD family) [Compostimonas suwonensis]
MAETHEAPAAPVELEITNVAHGGVFVARHEGRVVFVSDTVPGERVLVSITDDSHTSFWRAETLSVLEPSAHRRPHVWPAASIERAPELRAGGAEFGHIALAHQRELKRQVLADAFSRMAGVETDVTVEALGDDEQREGTGWRTRVKLHVSDDGELGPYAARSHRVIPVEELPLAGDAVAEAAPLGQRFAGAESVDVVGPADGSVHVLVNDAARPTSQRAQERRPIVETVGGRGFRLDARGFWQVHRLAASTLTDAVQSAVDESLFDAAAANLDLYGGVGLLAAALGDRFGDGVRMTSVESDARATDDASENLADWLGAQAVTARVDRYLQQLERTATAGDRNRLRAATVILDPPRSGAGKAVVASLGRLAPAQLVYVACDPVALARDVALFAPYGYTVASLRAFDLFPNTHHVEAVALLTREPAAR